jgi:hypothetical protein
MAKPASFRLPEDLVERIAEEATDRQTSVTALVSMLLDEGLKIRRFPGIVYREGPAGRRAGVVGGPDVWELISAVKSTAGRGEQKLKRLAETFALPAHQVRLALDFYAAHPEEIDERIAANERAAARMRKSIEHRERLLSR